MWKLAVQSGFVQTAGDIAGASVVFSIKALTFGPIFIS